MKKRKPPPCTYYFCGDMQCIFSNKISSSAASKGAVLFYLEFSKMNIIKTNRRGSERKLTAPAVRRREILHSKE